VFIHLGLPFETDVGNVRLRIVVGDISSQTVSFIQFYLNDILQNTTLHMTSHVCLKLICLTAIRVINTAMTVSFKIYVYYVDLRPSESSKPIILPKGSINDPY